MRVAHPDPGRARTRTALLAAGALALSTLGLLGTAPADAGLVHAGSQIARTDGSAAGLDDLVDLNARGDAAVAFRRGRISYVRTRPAGGQWRLALRVAGGVDPAAVTVDAAGEPTVFWHDGRIRFRSASNAEWDVKGALPGQARPHLAVDQGAGDALAAGYLTEDGLRVAYRSSGGHWRTPQLLSRRAVHPQSLRVFVDRRGRATVAWVEPGVAGDVLRVALSDGTGRFAAPRTLSRGAGTVGAAIDLDVRGSGAAVLAWRESVGDTATTLVRERAADGTWSEPEIPGLDVAEPQVGPSSDGGVRVTGRAGTDTGDTVLATSRTGAGGWAPPVSLVEPGGRIDTVRLTTSEAGSGFVTFRRRADDGTSHLWVSRADSAPEPFGPPEQVPRLLGDDGYSVAASEAGDLLLAVTSPTADGTDDPLTYLYAVAYDAAGPVTRLLRPRAPFTRSREIRLAWRAVDAWSGVAAHRVRVVGWRPDGTGRELVRLADLAGRTSRYSELGTNGHTYCFEVRSTDGQDHRGRWSDRRCAAVPLNDRELRRAGGWVKARSAGSYHDDVLRTRTEGAEVSLDVSTRRVALLASRCPGCGTVDVRLRGRLLRRIWLDAATVRRQARIPVARFARPQQGRLRVVVTSTGRRVEIDGIATSTR